MKNPINASNIRKPLRGILLLILLSIASNLFISSISQFYIVNREIDNIGRYYRSIGTITTTGFNYNVKEAREIISSDPMIKFEDNKRQTIGLIDGLYSVKRHSPNISDIEGSNLQDIIFIGEINYAYKSRSADNIYQGSILAINVREILAGIPSFIEGDYTYGFDQEHHIGFMSHSLITGERNEYINDDVIESLFELEPGKKYIFRSFIEQRLMEGSMAKPLYEGGPLYIELDSSGYIDWNDPQFKIIKDEIDFINENIIAYDVIGTKDMTAIPEVQESMKDYYLVEGRWLTEEDNKNRNHTIIIHERIAEMYEIDIGDKLEMRMRDSEYGEYLASEKDHREWRTYYTSELISFEVVGIFKSKVYTGGLYRSMYVPESTIPLELGRYAKGVDETILTIYPHLYSFVLKNLEDEESFIEKYRRPLEELGYGLNFVINNRQSFLEASMPINKSSMNSLILFTVLLILVQGFAVYVYIDGYKLSYAIERALGVPARVSGRHLTLPLIAPCIVVIFIGGYIGYRNAMEKSMKLLLSLAETTQKTIDSGLHIKYFMLFIVLSLIPFLIMLLMGVGRLRKLSVIDLINNNKRKEIVKIQEKVQRGDYVISEVPSKILIEEMEHEESMNEGEQYVGNEAIGANHRKKALRLFSLNYTLRSKVTSLFLIVIAGILIFSLLWMNYLTIKNGALIEKAYNQSIITADIETKEGGSSSKDTGSIDGRHIDNLFETGLVQEYTGIAAMFYSELYIDRDGVIEKYKEGEKDKIHFLTWKPSHSVYSSSQCYNTDNKSIELTELNFMAGYSLDNFYMEYTGDYSNTFNPVIIDENGKEGFPILVSNAAMEHFDLKLGDKIFLKPNSRYRKLSIESYGKIVGTFKLFNKGKDFYGYSSVIERDLFIYPLSVLEATEWEVYYDSLEFEFKPEKNRELMERKDEIRRIVASNPFNEHPTELRIWDGELRNVVEPLEKNVSLLEILYPITFILSIIIAAILSFIMVLRRTVDIAILRILGVKKKEVRWNLFRENMVLVLIGVLISLIIKLSITINSQSIDIEIYVMVIGGYLVGTIVGLLLGIEIVSNKKPLDLLQVKE